MIIFLHGQYVQVLCCACRCLTSIRYKPLYRGICKDLLLKPKFLKTSKKALLIQVTLQEVRYFIHLYKIYYIKKGLLNSFFTSKKNKKRVFCLFAQTTHTKLVQNLCRIICQPNGKFFSFLSIYFRFFIFRSFFNF